MRVALTTLALLALTACFTEGEDTDPDGTGVITFTVDGETFTETASIGASLQTGWMGITWNGTPDGDLGEDFYGSLTLSAYDGAGSYAPVMRQSDVDAVIEVATEAGSDTYYPLDATRGGDGSIEVDSADEWGATGTFSFTGALYGSEGVETDITGTFDVQFPAAD